LELSVEKTLSPTPGPGRKRALDEVIVQHRDSRSLMARSGHGRDCARVPVYVSKTERALYLGHGKPWGQVGHVNRDDFDIAVT